MRLNIQIKLSRSRYKYYKSLHKDKSKIDALHQYKNRCRKLAKDNGDFNVGQFLNYGRSYFVSYLRHVVSLVLVLVWVR